MYTCLNLLFTSSTRKTISQQKMERQRQPCSSTWQLYLSGLRSCTLRVYYSSCTVRAAWGEASLEPLLQSPSLHLTFPEVAEVSLKRKGA